MSFDSLRLFWEAQSKWSETVFGPTSERGPIGALKHLQKEVQETLDNPNNPEEYVDCLFLVFDSARRAGLTYDDLVKGAFGKLGKNVVRTWVRSANPDEPVEHQRGLHD